MVDDAASAARRCYVNLPAERFREIVIIGGNLDSRHAKWFTANVPVKMIEYLHLTAPGALNPLELMTAELPEVTLTAPPSAGHATALS
jgi:hypothetical protein